jgi:hypothetical protein
LTRQDDQKKELTRRLVERHSTKTFSTKNKYEDGLSQALTEVVRELDAERNGYYQRFYQRIKLN